MSSARKKSCLARMGRELDHARQEASGKTWRINILELIVAEYEKELAKQKELVEGQKNVIQNLNECIGGKGSTTTDNLVKFSRLPNPEEKCLLQLLEERSDENHQART